MTSITHSDLAVKPDLETLKFVELLIIVNSLLTLISTIIYMALVDKKPTFKNLEHCPTA